MLWTRGDRFWAEILFGDVRVSLGREADQSLWSSHSRKAGNRYTNNPDDLPQNMAQLCEIVSMSIPRLLDTVLADFEFHSDHVTTHSGRSRTLVWATLRPDRTHALVSDALLEIDDETDVLTRLVLWTVQNGRPRGTHTLTLVESAPADDTRYELQSHVDDDAVIKLHTPRDPKQRDDRSQQQQRPQKRRPRAKEQTPAAKAPTTSAAP